MNSLQAWIETYGGVNKLARKLGVTNSTIIHWVKRRGYPKATTMETIIKLSKGQMSFESIMHSTRPRK